MRGIFPNVVSITTDGTVEITEDVVQRLFEELIAERRSEMIQPATHSVDVRRPPQEDNS
jgi:hypothetical protein